MQKPPDKISPPTLFSRTSYEWINRIGQKAKHFASLNLSLEEKDALRVWMETEFVFAVLKLDHLDAPREEVEKFASRPTELAGWSDDERAIVTLVEALRTVETLIKDFDEKVELAPDVLIRLHNPLGGIEGFRKSDGEKGRPFEPTPAARLPLVIESACRWFAAESFRELNPIEQAAIVYLRLLEFQPFEHASDRTSLVAASLFTRRRGLPPIIIRPAMDALYRAAIREALQMNTRPMVELMAAGVEESLDEMIGAIEVKRQKEKGKK